MLSSTIDIRPNLCYILFVADNYVRFYSRNLANLDGLSPILKHRG